MSIPARLEKFSLLFLALIMPLAFYSGAEDAYRLVQLAALSVGVAGLALGLLGAEKAFARGLPDTLVRCYFLLRVLSRVVGGWGDPGLGLFLAEQSCYFLLFLWAAGHLGRQDLAQKTRDFLLLGAGLAAAYGVLQTLGLDPLARLAAPTGFGARSYSSLGNPDFFGGHLVLLIPLALAPWLLTPAKVLARFTLLLALLLLSLLLSQTRGAWIGLGASLAGLVAASRAQVNWKRLGALAGAGALALVLFSFPNPLNRAGMNSLGRLAAGFTSTDTAGQGRMFMAKAALNAALKKPWLGHGAGRFTRAYLDAQAELLAKPENASQPFRFTNDAHNDYLQILVESGFPALLLFLAVIVLTLRKLWTIQGPLAKGLFAGILGLCFHALFHFPLSIVPTTAFFWLFIGWAIALSRAPDAQTRPYPKKAAYALVALAACMAFVAVHALVANAAFHQGMNLMAVGQAGPARPYLQKALALDQGDYRYFFQMGRCQDALNNPAEAEMNFKGALRLLPDYPEAWANLGLSRGKQGDMKGAEEDCQKALDFNPRSLETLGNLGKAQYMQGKKSQAEETYKAGLLRDPSWAEGNFNLGAIYYNEGKKAEALKYFQAALAADPNHAGARGMVEKMKRANAFPAR